MLFITLIAVIVSIVSATGFTSAKCSARTSIFNTTLVNNINYYAYDPRTYIGAADAIIPMTSAAYRDIIRDTITCTGVWCVDGEYKCGRDNRRCYNVEHIIPVANTIPAIAGCSVNIRGNYIMAYGQWNLIMSNRYYGEKKAIYGEDIVKSAYNSVFAACFGRIPATYPDELCLSGTATDDYFVLIMVPFVIVSLVVVVIVIRRYPPAHCKELWV